MGGKLSNILKILLFLALFPAVSFHPAQAEVLTIKESKSLYGIFDVSAARFIVEPRYEKLSLVEGNIYKAVLKGRTGLITVSGDVLIEFKYHDLYRIGKHYLAQVDFDSTTYGSPQRSGNVTTITKYHRIEYKYGLLDAEGNIVIPIEHDLLRPLAYPVIFEAGVRTHYEPTSQTTREARFRYGVVDINNNVVLPIEYDRVSLIKNQSGGNKLVLTYSKAGGPPQTMEYNVKKGSPEARGPVNPKGKVVKYKSGDRYGFKTGSGEVVAEPVYEDAWDFKNGFARIKKDGKWGFLSESGKTVVEPKYDYVWDYSGGKAKVRLDDGRTRVIDPEGKVLEE
jgi:hypothetical protein